VFSGIGEIWPKAASTKNYTPHNEAVNSNFSANPQKRQHFCLFALVQTMKYPIKP
jgi:hypothetical protein